MTPGGGGTARLTCRSFRFVFAGALTVYIVITRRDNPPLPPVPSSSICLLSVSVCSPVPVSPLRAALPFDLRPCIGCMLVTDPVHKPPRNDGTREHSLPAPDRGPVKPIVRLYDYVGCTRMYAPYYIARSAARDDGIIDSLGKSESVSFYHRSPIFLPSFFFVQVTS